MVFANIETDHRFFITFLSHAILFGNVSSAYIFSWLHVPLEMKKKHRWQLIWMIWTMNDWNRRCEGQLNWQCFGFISCDNKKVGEISNSLEHSFWVVYHSGISISISTNTSSLYLVIPELYTAITYFIYDFLCGKHTHGLSYNQILCIKWFPCLHVINLYDIFLLFSTNGVLYW